MIQCCFTEDYCMALAVISVITNYSTKTEQNGPDIMVCALIRKEDKKAPNEHGYKNT